MTHILSILRAAHCRSTHHYFALDALQNLKTAQAQRLANILLKYHDDYLDGAKAPDCNFKDFQNHVIHVSDGNWGGAPQKCQEWLAQARQYLDDGKWKKAAYACGVLSHYFTDPIMPLHTAQHPREQVVHRPLEWSICQSYQQIYDLSQELGLECDFALAVDELWISKAVRAAAEVAHRHYDRLVAIYDVARGVVKPREGLNDEAMSILAELFALAIGGWSRVLTRLADETTKELPQVSLSLTSVLATIDMPLAWIVRRISQLQERRAVQALFNEYTKTGSLKRHLPAEIVVVNKVKKADPTLGQTTPQLTTPQHSPAELDSPQQAAPAPAVLKQPTAEQVSLEQVATTAAPSIPVSVAAIDLLHAKTNLSAMDLQGAPLATTEAAVGDSSVPQPIESIAVESIAVESSEVESIALAAAKETLTEISEAVPAPDVAVAKNPLEISAQLETSGVVQASESLTSLPVSIEGAISSTSEEALAAATQADQATAHAADRATYDEIDQDVDRPADQAADQYEPAQFVSLSQARRQGSLQIHRPRQLAPDGTTLQATGDAAQHNEQASRPPAASPALRIAPGTMLPTADTESQNTVHYGSPLIDAPSIGPKTAKRFENIGITTIRQLISTSPETIVRELSTRWITQDLVQDWQDQARLVCEVPALSGYRAQLLVAVGCRTSWQLRTGNPNTLHAQIAQFCQTAEGQQILRSARLPQVEDIAGWIESARIYARREVA